MTTPAANCSNCNTALTDEDLVCPSCSAPRSVPEPDQPYATFGAGIVDRSEPEPPNIQKAARWLLYLATMFVIFGTFYGMKSRWDAKDALEVLAHYDDTEMIEVEGEDYTVAELETKLKRAIWLVFVVNYLLAAVMLGLFVWARTNPYHAMITGLCVYLGVIVLNAIYDLDSMYQGIFFKVLFISAMVAGIRAAYAERVEAAKLPRATLA